MPFKSINFIKIKFFFFHRKNSSNSRKGKESNKSRYLFKHLCSQSTNSTSDVQIHNLRDELSENSSRCGGSSERNKLSKPFLRPITLTEEITLEERIGVGGYGCVYRGKWHGYIIAVKIFLSSEEPSWGREVEIYKTPGLNHENILRYIAADNTVSIRLSLSYPLFLFKDISNRIELWLATEYHENGSVYDYLQNHTITIQILTKMIVSIVDGLWILHKSIDATNGLIRFF
jgi:hypothetical protein